MRPHTDEGASAVEFALLFPVFLLLVFGMISAGQGYSHKIAITQAAREGSRYGSTLPIPPDTGQSIANWLSDVLAATIAAGTPDLNASTAVPGQWVCVAYIAPNAGGSQPTQSLTKVGDAAPVQSGTPCWDDTASGMTTPRVQVEIRRSTNWNLLIVNPAVLTLQSQSVTPYERGFP
jgi:Flp pilus assembly protein TadG